MRNSPQNPKEIEVQDSPWGGFCMRIIYFVLKKQNSVTSFPLQLSQWLSTSFPFPSPHRILGKLKHEHLISPDVLITEGPHMHTHSWIFLDFYRLLSFNFFFTLHFVAAAGRHLNKSPSGRGPGRGRLQSSLTQWRARSRSEDACCQAAVPEAFLAAKRKQTTAIKNYG